MLLPQARQVAAEHARRRLVPEARERFNRLHHAGEVLQQRARLADLEPQALVVVQVRVVLQRRRKLDERAFGVVALIAQQHAEVLVQAVVDRAVRNPLQLDGKGEKQIEIADFSDHSREQNFKSDPRPFLVGLRTFSSLILWGSISACSYAEVMARR